MLAQQRAVGDTEGRCPAMRLNRKPDFDTAQARERRGAKVVQNHLHRPRLLRVEVHELVGGVSEAGGEAAQAACAGHGL